MGRFVVPAVVVVAADVESLGDEALAVGVDDVPTVGTVRPGGRPCAGPGSCTRRAGARSGAVAGGRFEPHGGCAGLHVTDDQHVAFQRQRCLVLHQRKIEPGDGLVLWHREVVADVLAGAGQRDRTCVRPGDKTCVRGPVNRHLKLAGGAQLKHAMQGDVDLVGFLGFRDPERLPVAVRDRAHSGSGVAGRGERPRPRA